HAVAPEQRDRESRAALGFGRSLGARGTTRSPDQRASRHGRGQKRPPSLAARRSGATGAERAPPELPPRTARSRPPDVRPQRGERVVGDFSRPDQVPQRIDDLARERARLSSEIREKERAPALEQVADRAGELPLRASRRRREEKIPIRKVETDSAVMRTDRLEAAPHHFSRRAEKVEVRRLAGQVAGG